MAVVGSYGPLEWCSPGTCYCIIRLTWLKRQCRYAAFIVILHQSSADRYYSIELGTGGGLVGLTVARGCNTTKPIVITDQRPMLPLMQNNIALNHLTPKVTAVVYDWGNPVRKIIPPLFEAKEPQWYPDVVLAADCVYFEPAFPLLLGTLTDLLGPETVCYFCFKKRRKADWWFIKQMQKQFDAKPVPYRGREEDRRHGIYLYEVRRKTPQA